jgi:transposase InsO family protein
MHKPYTPWPLGERIRLVAIYDELRKKQPRFSARRFSAYHDVPYSSFCRWLARFRGLGAAALRDRSHAPRRRPNKLSGQEETVIRRAHRALKCGVHRVYAYLRAARLTTRSFSSIYRVLSRCGALVRRRRRPKPHWQLYAKAWPGERAQMDIKYLPESLYQLTLIDDCSRVTAATVIPGRTQVAVIEALPRLLGAFPFPFSCIQTDNGAEFESVFHRWLQQQGIRHVRTRVRQPHLNGKVERVQRTIQEEYWDGVTSLPGPAWERGLQTYLRAYNRRRPHRSLDYQTPWAYALERLTASAPNSQIT